MMKHFTSYVLAFAAIAFVAFSMLSPALAQPGGYFGIGEAYDEEVQDLGSQRRDTRGTTAKRILTSWFGSLIMGICGLTGLFCLLYSGGGDSSASESSKSEMQLLVGSIALIVTACLFIYRFFIWWNRMTGRDISF